MKHPYQNREVSAISFNERVLQEAEDTRNPLMERLRFLGIFSSNMDEFFKVRVASIQRQIELGKGDMAPILEVIGDKSRELDERFQAAYAGITAALAVEGVKIVTEKDVAAEGGRLAEWLTDYFRANVLPMMVPIIVDEHLQFPQLTDGALYFAVRMWGERPPYAILEIPSSLPRFVELPNGNIMYVDDVIRHCLNDVFYIFEYDRIEAYEFKISRDAELDIDNDFSESYVQKMERVLAQRKGGRPTRFVYDASIPPGLRILLIEALDITGDDTLIPGGRYHNMKDLMRFPGHRPDLFFPKPGPAPHPELTRDRTPMHQTVAQQDVLITYPYQSFDHLIRFLREAAIDPKVEEIKMTLYRAAHGSQVVNALVNAARNGKRVFVSVELQARFDELHNITIAEKLTEVGATVVFGVPPMKVHAKVLLIKRGALRIAGLSTGNFNEATGRLYVDSTLLTADKRLVNDVAEVFEFLDHASRTRTMAAPKFKHLMVSPFNARKTISKLIEREKDKRDDGYIFMKVNHLTDERMVKKLHEAASAGVRMDMIIRTTSALKPHPNIRAISILDRYLEHQRVFMFGEGKDRRVYLSSADLMERNLDWRVEAAFPVYSPTVLEQVEAMMRMQASDDYKARILDETQSNPYAGGATGTRRAQIETMAYFQKLYRDSLPHAAADGHADHLANGAAQGGSAQVFLENASTGCRPTAK